MKPPIVLTLLVVGLLSCNEFSNSSENKRVQHDTIQTSTGIIKKDTIIQTGEYIKHYENGVIQMRGIMKDGKRDGVWKSWYQDGSSWSETTFKNGKKNGKTITWYENEKKRYEGFYTDDNESGKWEFWDEQGKLVNNKEY